MPGRRDPPPVLSQLFFQVLSPEPQLCSKLLAMTWLHFNTESAEPASVSSFNK